jgi:glutaconyl-CoA/methylmalonyl-CoA decarboxylase subunit gamma
VLHELEIAGRPHKVTVQPSGGGFAVTVGGRTWQVDAARIDGQLLSLLVRDVSPKSDGDPIQPASAHEVAVWPGRRPGQLTVAIGAATIPVTLNGHRRRSDNQGMGEGAKQVLAPMPGKIVRVLVKPGEVVRARQPLVVVEAMKMENELRAGGDGTVVEVKVQEGASVDAGALLVVIE